MLLLTIFGAKKVRGDKWINGSIYKFCQLTVTDRFAVFFCFFPATETKKFCQNKHYFLFLPRKKVQGTRPEKYESPATDVFFICSFSYVGFFSTSSYAYASKSYDAFFFYHKAYLKKFISKLINTFQFKFFGKVGLSGHLICLCQQTQGHIVFRLQRQGFFQSFQGLFGLICLDGQPAQLI